ncbi:MAG: hypothetical protein IE928_07075 [Gammaproteobacteria bacterium]|nr:hypothetical protein [Gammaproteobacteria bacterium]
MKHLEAAMVALKEGRFGVTVETNAPGSYGLMLNSVADSMKVLSLVVADINQIMQSHTSDPISAESAAQPSATTPPNRVATPMSGMSFEIKPDY